MSEEEKKLRLIERLQEIVNSKTSRDYDRYLSKSASGRTAIGLPPAGRKKK